MAAINDLLYKKRLGGELTREEIHDFVQGVTSARFADYQISAMLMAIAINGMTERETVDLTMEMAASGDMLDGRLWRTRVPASRRRTANA